MRNLSSLALLLLLGAAAAAAHSAPLVEGALGAPYAALTAAPGYAAALAEVDSQIEAHLGEGAAAEATAEEESAPQGSLASYGPQTAVPPMGSQYQPSDERFRATSQEVVSAYNSLDLATGLGEGEGAEAPAKPEAHKRPVVAAYATIAVETVHRAASAKAFLAGQHAHLKTAIKVELHNYKMWVEAQHDAAKTRIQKEVDRVGLLTDEVSHLEHVYKDAVAKERSYQVQANQLTTERQLQRTPPLIPAVTASALSDAQYEAALTKLKDFREKALQVMHQTSGAIRSRRLAIEKGTEWIANSKKTLETWMVEQNALVGEHEKKGKKAVTESELRMEAVTKILSQATEYHTEYMHALQYIDLQARVDVLKKAKDAHAKLKAPDEYAKTRIAAFVKAIDLEIAGIEGKLKKIPGEGKCKAPPSFWGILSQYGHLTTAIPHIGGGQTAIHGAVHGGSFGVGAHAATYPLAYGASPMAATGHLPSTGNPAGLYSPLDDSSTISHLAEAIPPSPTASPLTPAEAYAQGQAKAASAQVVKEATAAPGEGEEASALETSATATPRFRSVPVPVAPQEQQHPVEPAMPALPEVPRSLFSI